MIKVDDFEFRAFLFWQHWQLLQNRKHWADKTNKTQFYRKWLIFHLSDFREKVFTIVKWFMNYLGIQFSIFPQTTPVRCCNLSNEVDATWIWVKKVRWIFTFFVRFKVTKNEINFCFCLVTNENCTLCTFSR